MASWRKIRIRTARVRTASKRSAQPFLASALRTARVETICATVLGVGSQRYEPYGSAMSCGSAVGACGALELPQFGFEVEPEVVTPDEPLIFTDVSQPHAIVEPAWISTFSVAFISIAFAMIVMSPVGDWKQTSPSSASMMILLFLVSNVIVPLPVPSSITMFGLVGVIERDLGALTRLDHTRVVLAALVVGRRLVLAVPQRADDQRAIEIAVLEHDEHFVLWLGDKEPTAVLAGARHHDRHPVRGLVLRQDRQLELHAPELLRILVVGDDADQGLQTLLASSSRCESVPRTGSSKP